MVKLTVRRRIVLLMLMVSLIPLALANAIWLLSSQAELRAAAAAQQKLLVKSSADAVDYFIDDKIDAAIIHSQTAGVQTFQLAEAQIELQAYLKQDADLTQISLVDAQGKQRLLVSRSGTSTAVTDVSSDPAFRVVTFLGGEDYIGPVTFDAQHNAYVTIAVPLLNYTTTQAGTYLSTSEPGVILAPSQIKGALIMNVALKSLWNSVLADELGGSGYAYIVDHQGNLVAYPNATFGEKHSNLSDVAEVKAALAQTQVPGGAVSAPDPHQTVSETGQQVLSSHYPVARTDWVVVAEEPISSVYAPVRNDELVAAGFFALSALVGLGLIILTARGLLRPIRVLSEGADQLAGGNLGARISLPRQDEFGLLARTFNNMAAKISADIAQLQGVDQLKNEFITIASHHLRTPLTVINGYLEIMRDQDASEDTRKMLGIMADSARELSRFSSDMLTISTIEAGYANLDITDITVQKLLAPVRAVYTERAQQNGINLVWSVAEPHTNMRLSPVHIRSVLANLLSNALEYTPTGGRVDLEIAVRPDSYVMTVRDTGIGIEPAQMQQLFTVFHRGTGMLRYDHPGRGIGLYLTRLVVEAHHGRITVRSQRGHGATFIITLPKL